MERPESLDVSPLTLLTKALGRGAVAPRSVFLKG